MVNYHSNGNSPQLSSSMPPTQSSLPSHLQLSGIQLPSLHLIPSLQGGGSPPEVGYHGNNTLVTLHWQQYTLHCTINNTVYTVPNYIYLKKRIHHKYYIWGLSLFTFYPISTEDNNFVIQYPRFFGVPTMPLASGNNKICFNYNNINNKTVQQIVHFYTLYIKHCTILTTQHTLYNIQYILHSIHYTEYTVQYTLHKV